MTHPIYLTPYLEDRNVSVYLAGPMSGIPDFNFPRFNAAAANLRADGYVVFNPAEQGSGDGDVETGVTSEQGWREFLADDLRWIMAHADAIVVLPGWEKSRGATLEVKVARHAGIPVYSYPALALMDEQKSDERIALEAIAGADNSWNVRGYAQDVLDGTYVENAKSYAFRSPPECGHAPSAQEEVVLCMDCLSNAAEEERSDETFIGLEEYEYEQRVTDSATGGAKGRKLARFALIPAQALRALARHYGIGALKYDDHNWLRGYEWDLSLDAIERHLNAFRRGESVYVERFEGRDGKRYAVETHHLIAVAWQAFTLYIFERFGIGTDTRPAAITESLATDHVTVTLREAA